MLILYLGIKAGLFPAGGYGSGLVGHLQALFLPALTVSFSILPFTIRSLRSSMIDVLESDFVASARARGLGGAVVLRHHVLRNALVPVVVVLGLNVGWLVGNTLIIERIFAIPGLGSFLLDSILSRDFPAVQGIALVVALMVVLVNVTTDVARAGLDPRARQP
jgi:peptide/nickel transport system permease protein